MAGNSEIDARTCDLRLTAQTQHSALSTSTQCWDSEQSAEFGVAVSVHLYPLGFGMARPSTDHVRSHDAATCCRASLAACKPRRRLPKSGRNGSFGVYFEHLYTGVNGVGKRDQARGRGSGSLSGNSFPRSCVGMPSSTLRVVPCTRQGTQSVPDDAPTGTVGASGMRWLRSEANPPPTA